MSTELGPLAGLDIESVLTVIRQVLPTDRAPRWTARVRAMGMGDEEPQAFATTVEQRVPALHTLVLDVKDPAEDLDDGDDVALFLGTFLEVRAVQEVRVRVAGNVPRQASMLTVEACHEHLEVVAKERPMLRTPTFSSSKRPSAMPHARDRPP